MMKTLLLTVLSACAVSAQAQTVPFNATAPMRGGAQNQTAVPPVNPGLNQSTIQGPPEVQRTSSSYDAQPSRLPEGTPVAGTPELSPTSVPDVREQPLIQQQRRRQSTDIVPSRSRASRSDDVDQNYQHRPAQAPLSPQ